MGKARDLANVGSVASTGLQFRNLLINGDMRIWQRGTSFTYNSNTSRGFGADRFYCEAYPLNLTYSKSTITFDGTTYDSASLSSITGGFTMFQAIEGGYVRTKGKTVTYSFVASGSGTLNIQTWVGTIGQQTISGASATLSATPTRFKFTFTIPSNGTGNDLYIGFGGSGGSVNVSLIQLELGSDATPFEFRPLALEDTLCKRFYEAGSFYRAENGNYYASQRYMNSHNYSVRKRVSPSVSLTLTGGWPTISGANIYVDGGDANMFWMVDGNAVASLYNFTFTASAEL
jgi:hypothetical protein